MQPQVLIDSIDLTWHHVAECNHLATNVMIDRHTHIQTNFFPFGQKHNTFFQRYNEKDKKWEGGNQHVMNARHSSYIVHTELLLSISNKLLLISAMNSMKALITNDWENFLKQCNLWRFYLTRTDPLFSSAPRNAQLRNLALFFVVH